MSEARPPQNCPECDRRLGFEADETVCTDYGLVVSEYRTDRGPERRSFADDGHNPARASAPLTRLRHDRSLSTEIGRLTHIKGRKRRQFTRMRRQHSRARVSTKREHNQMYAFTEVHRVTSTLLLPNRIHDQARSSFESAQNEDLLCSRPLEGSAAACACAACRVAGVSRSAEEVCDMSKVTRAKHQAAYGALSYDLGLPVAPTDPTEYLPRLVTKFDPDSDTERQTCEYTAETCDEGLAGGKDPYGITTACPYTAVSGRGEDCTQAEAADVADVTPVTLRKTYVALRE